MKTQNADAASDNAQPAASHTPSLVATGRAIYTADDWHDGVNRGGKYVAQVFAEPDHDLQELSGLLDGQRVLENDNEADHYTNLFAAAPELLAASQKLLRNLLRENNRLKISTVWLDDISAAIASATGGKVS